MDTIETTVNALAESVEHFSLRANPGAREIYITQEVDAIRRKWNVDDLDALNPAYVDNLRAKKEAAFTQETRALDAEIAPQFKALRASLTEKFADSRRLRRESERVDPALHPDRYVNARLLDEIATERAEKWYAENRDNPQAILARFLESDDHRDVHFVALIEMVYGRSDEAPGDDTGFAFPLAKAVRTRQDARIPASLRAALEKVDEIEATYTKARAQAFPSNETITRAVGAVLRRAN